MEHFLNRLSVLDKIGKIQYYLAGKFGARGLNAMEKPMTVFFFLNKIMEKPMTLFFKQDNGDIRSFPDLEKSGYPGLIAITSQAMEFELSL